MKTDNNHWQLIAKYLAGECDPAERRTVENLISTDDAFASAFDEAKEIWEKLPRENIVFDKGRIIALRDKRIKEAQRFTLKNFLPYAAALALLFAAAYLFLFRTSNTVNLVACRSDIINYTLPDGSLVSLRKGAEISYNKNFDRRIKLIKGEAFFTVQKDHGKGFTVMTKDYNINVLGTKFDVLTGGNYTSVVLAEGKIKLTGFEKQAAEGIILVPGDRLVYKRATAEIIKSTVNPAVYYLWKENKIMFNRFSIYDLKEIFKIYYHKTLIINNKDIERRQIGGSAPTDDLKLIIRGLSEVLHREITQSNDTIIIN